MAKLRVEGYSVYLDDANERAKFDFAFAVGTAIMADELNPYAAPWEKHLTEDPPYISYHGGMSNVFRSIVKRISSMSARNTLSRLAHTVQNMISETVMFTVQKRSKNWVNTYYSSIFRLFRWHPHFQSQ